MRDPNLGPQDRLGREVQRIISRWGVDIFLQRRIYNTGQGIYSVPNDSSETKESLPGVDTSTDPDRNYYSNKLERWTVRYTFAGRKTALTSIEVGRPEGEVHSIPLVFYFTAEASPKEGDRIYLRDPRYKDTRFPTGLGESTWIITYAESVIGWRGRIEYFEAGARREYPS